MKLGGSCYISARSVQGHWASMQTKGCYEVEYFAIWEGKKYEQTLSRSLMPMKKCLYDWYSYVRTWSQGGLFWRCISFSSLKWLFCLAYPWDSTESALFTYIPSTLCHGFLRNLIFQISLLMLCSFFSDGPHHHFFISLLATLFITSEKMIFVKFNT